MAIGGISVILAIVAIFFYLLYVVVPLFESAQIERAGLYTAPLAEHGPTLQLAMEEQSQIGARLTQNGHVVFFNTVNGRVITDTAIALPPNTTITTSALFADGQTFVVGLNDGRAVVVKQHYEVTYEESTRVITPKLEYPLGNAPLLIDTQGTALTHIIGQGQEETATFVAATTDGRLVMADFSPQKSLLEEESTPQRLAVVLAELADQYTHLLLDPERRRLYVGHANGDVSHYNLATKREPHLVERIRVTGGTTKITAMQLLTGGTSLLIGTSAGSIMQWFAVRDANNRYALTKIREFNAQRAPITVIAPELARKGFIAGDAQGTVGLYHATAERVLRIESLGSSPIVNLALAPRANALFAQDSTGMVSFERIHNPHPEVSWSSLWGKVWYEGYDKPQFMWQSSASNNDFEPKFSLTPLAFGTFKAAFFAMLIAIPFAIMGALYTAYFMAPRMRQVVKPTIEIMEALPTVILGFLAGLWLAPLVEENLPGVFMVMVAMPLSMLLFGYLWQRPFNPLRYKIGDGWLAALLIPVVILVTWAAMAASHPMENLFFGGNMRSWLGNEMGIDFDQRNALVVGLAMGFAIIPPIFSIAEDAVFSVPKHLVNGSLALGATPWQTLIGVVLLTASPGIFSGIMIGLGRAAGETMIVLMATGNTPVMDMSIFQGLRTLSANIAVEMPESEVGGTHYRVLFLAALVLFMFTFFFNTVAEIVRQRLRKKYSSL